MKANRFLPVLLAFVLAAPAFAQAAATSYEVRRGDTLSAVARKTRLEGVNRNQMLVAIYRANQAVFPDGRIHTLRAGQVLAIPGREEAAALTPAEARREVQALFSMPVMAPVAAERAYAPSAKAAPAEPGAPALLGREKAATRYQEGLGEERKGRNAEALAAFLEAGESGYGPAQKKLGEIYDSGNSAVARDYQVSLKWYEKAREQGVPIENPAVLVPRAGAAAAKKF